VKSTSPGVTKSPHTSATASKLCDGKHSRKSSTAPNGFFCRHTAQSLPIASAKAGLKFRTLQYAIFPGSHSATHGLSGDAVFPGSVTAIRPRVCSSTRFIFIGVASAGIPPTSAPKRRAISTASAGFNPITGCGAGNVAGRIGTELIEAAEGARFRARIFSMTAVTFPAIRGSLGEIQTPTNAPTASSERMRTVFIKLTA
jgi:hypothetical protein